MNPPIRLPSFSELGASIDSSHVGGSGSISPTSFLRDTAREDEDHLQNNLIDSMVGPRRTSATSIHGQHNWPYEEQTPLDATYSYQGNGPPNMNSLFDVNGQPRLLPGTILDGNQLFAQDANLQSLPYMGYNQPSMDTNVYPYPYGNMMMHSQSQQMPPYQSSSGCLSPTMSNHSQFDLSQGDGSELLENPIHIESQTTKATKLASEARRKPGTAANFKCEYCGETCVALNLSSPYSG